VIHLAFDHDFSSPDTLAKSVAEEGAALAALGEELAGSDRPLVTCSGTPYVPGRASTEADPLMTEGPVGGRGRAVTSVLGLSSRGVRSSAVRLPRSANFDISVVHVAPSEPHSIFIDNLRSLDEAGLINLVARYDDEHGILDINDLAEFVPDLHERTTFACGPAGLLDALARHHDELGLELLTEQFRLANLVVGEGGTVSFTENGTQVEAAGDRPILEQAEEAGVLMPSGCRMGICYGCVLPLREGAVRDLRNGEITTAAPGDGVLIQTCVSAAAGACDIDH
jgi:ferredoxin